MATPMECIDLLTALSALDPRIRFDQATATVWAHALHDIPDEILVTAGIEAARTNTYGTVTIGMIIEAAQPHIRQINRTVKSAKIRGIVPTNWPDNRPLPQDVIDRLRREFEATNNYPEEIEALIKRNRGITG